MNWKNPFRLKYTPDGPMYEVLRQGGPGATVFTSDELHTSIVIHNVETVSDVVDHEPGHISGPVIARLPGLWAPPPETVIQVCDPNRDVIVTEVRYQVEPDGLVAMVYVRDSDRESA